MDKTAKNYKYIYGPVNSWRLGKSLGVDVLSQKAKTCNLNCIYCQVGSRKPLAAGRRVYVPTKEILDEIRSLPEEKFDYITFSGSGEPTLARNLGSLIAAVKSIRSEKIAVLTNSTLLGKKAVRKELATADLVEAKLDASQENVFAAVNHPAEGISFKGLVKGIKEFRRGYKGTLALQIMFVKDNLAYAKDIARIARSIKPCIVHINTPLRPSPVSPVSKKDIRKVKSCFKDMKVFSVYDSKRRKGIRPINRTATHQRRGAA